MKPEAGGSLDIDQRIYAPAEEVATFIGDFRNAKEWMVGVEAVERLGEDRFRLTLERPDRETGYRGQRRRARPAHHTLGLRHDDEGGGQVDVRRRLTAASSPTGASST